jgi:hypothetical protein
VNEPKTTQIGTDQARADTLLAAVVRCSGLDWLGFLPMLRRCPCVNRASGHTGVEM